MSFSRIKYDNEAYDLKLNRTVAPGDYRLYKGFNESCNKCFSYDGPKNSKSDVSIGKQFDITTEIESHLTNRINKLVDFNKYGTNDFYKNIPTINNSKCDNNLIAEDTRFTFPIEAFRSMDLTSYHYSPFLYVNPNCEIQEDRIGLNSRLRVKDTFVTLPTKPIDQSIFLPKGGNDVVDLSQTYNGTVNMCKNLVT